MQIEFSSRFQKSYKKLLFRRPDVAILILQKILLFSQEPNSPRLYLHKLKGKLKDVWAFSIEGDLRIIVDLKDRDKVLFVDIGTHEDVY